MSKIPVVIDDKRTNTSAGRADYAMLYPLRSDIVVVGKDVTGATVAGGVLSITEDVAVALGVHPISSLSPTLWYSTSYERYLPLPATSGVKLWPNAADATNALVLPGVNSNYASAPDSAALSVTGSIDLRIDCQPTDWSPSAYQGLIVKAVTVGQLSYGFYLDTGSSGKLMFQRSLDGTTIDNVVSTVATGFTDGDRHWVRATYNSSNGYVNFYTSSDGSSWTPLGAEVTTLASGAIYDGNTALAIGERASTYPFSGRIYRAIIKNGIDGTTVFDADFTKQTRGATSFTESSSNAATVTVNQSGATPAHLGAAGDLLQGADTNRPIHRKNFATYTEDLSNAVWATTVGGTGSASKTSYNSGTDPLGGSTADRVALSLNGGTTTSDLALIRQAVAIPSGASATHSVWAKSFDGSSSYAAQIIAPDGNASAVTITGSWQRFSATANGTGSAVNMGIRLSGGQTPTNSDSADILIWGQQVELGSTATSYQRVAAAADYDTSVISPVYFPGVDEYLRTVAIASLVQPTTVVMVVNQVSWTATEYLCDGASAANTGAVRQKNAGTTPEIELYAGAAAATNTNLAVGSYGVVTAIFTGANSSLRVNNTAATTGNTGTNNMGGFTVGSNAVGSSLWSNIAVKEVAVFNYALTAPQIASVVAYLGAKWGISV